jgi:hypothetical protein
LPREIEIAIRGVEGYWKTPSPPPPRISANVVSEKKLKKGDIRKKKEKEMKRKRK